MGCYPGPMIKRVYKFDLSLNGISPAIWRKILVPESFSFWDLHVAIQDSMGWLDCHLHTFQFGKPRSRDRIEIGIPLDESFDGVETLPGWHVSIPEFFAAVGDRCIYEYDFGDGWEHTVILEAIMLAEKRRRYPRCSDGERACPPEDCGGVGGYYNVLEVISGPQDDEYEDMIEWLGGKYNPEKFVPGKVKFDNPSKRWKLAFADEP